MPSDFFRETAANYGRHGKEIIKIRKNNTWYFFAALVGC
jgi:hypothetical protein